MPGVSVRQSRIADRAGADSHGRLSTLPGCCLLVGREASDREPGFEVVQQAWQLRRAAGYGAHRYPDIRFFLLWPGSAPSGRGPSCSIPHLPNPTPVSLVSSPTCSSAGKGMRSFSLAQWTWVKPSHRAVTP